MAKCERILIPMLSAKESLDACGFHLRVLLTSSSFKWNHLEAKLQGICRFPRISPPSFPFQHIAKRFFYLPKWDLYTFCGGFWCMGLMLYTKNVIPDYKHYLSDVIAYHETRVISIPTLLL